MLILGLLINSLSIQAQNLCLSATGTGGFTVPKQVCLGTTVAVTGAPTSLTNTVYIYDYKGTSNPTSFTSANSYRYSAPGSYTILQIAAITGGTSYACQVVEVLPTKEVSYKITTCSDRLASLTYTLDAETLRYNFLNINWGDGTPEQIVILNGSTTTNTIPHTYARAGNFVVRVAGSYRDGCTGNTFSQPVTILNTAAADPTILALTSDATKATINYQGPDGFNLELYQKGAGNTYTPTGLTGTSGGFFTVPASPSTVNCFQVVAKDVCGGAERRSSRVCSLVLTAEAGDRRNVISWEPYAGDGTVRLYRGYKDGSPAWSGPTSPYTDNVDVTCGKTNCYALEATVGPTIVRSMSTCVSGTNNSSVASPTSTYVLVQPNGVNIQATLPTVGLPSPYTLIVTRSDGSGGAFTPLGVSDDRSYIDATAETNSQSYCYQTAIRNSCGVVSKPTPAACTILLTKKADGSLTWTSASPYSDQPPQSYQVIFIDPLTGASDKKPLGNVTAYKPDPDSQVTQYQIAAVNRAGIESYSNPIEVELGLRVFVPNAFTPNGDAQNSSFMAKGLMTFWDKFEMTIYSRWGDVVYNTTDKDTTGWNGEMNGTPAQSGYYGYRVKVVDMSGKVYERTGQVLLIR